MNKKNVPSYELPPIVEGFGIRLRKARIDAGYETQPALAAVMKINVNTISRHEAGSHLPKMLDMIYHYARVLKVSVSYLQHGIPTPSAVTSYLASANTQGLLPETCNRLLNIPWSYLVIGEPDLLDVEKLAMVIDRGFRRLSGV